MRHRPRIGLVAEVVRGAFHLFSEVETSGLEPPTPCLQISPRRTPTDACGLISVLQVQLRTARNGWGWWINGVFGDAIPTAQRGSSRVRSASDLDRSHSSSLIVEERKELRG
jgi:hypothetical protein